ncbi:MAG: hypothetical protein CSA29_00140 [Desulfobacterales bacterium]|nr:MAG: hypothetical protein CSA29_00140 [Desulfobacterales bacterium]
MSVARFANRFSSFCVYTLLLLITVEAGSLLFKRSKQFSFYAHYLLKWESALTQLKAKDTIWPEFKGTNHIEYMDGLIKLMKAHHIDVPTSNTQCAYVWRLEKEPEIKDVFVLCMDKKIILFGLSKSLFDRLDKQIDGENDPLRGQFNGKLQRNKGQYVGIWEI